MNKIKSLIKQYKIQSIILVSLIFISIIVMVFKNSLADSNSGYLKNTTVDGLSFENINLECDDGISTYTAEVYNESGSTYELKTISINITDEDGNTYTLTGYIGDSLDNGEAKILKASIDEDLSDAKSIEYVINK